MHIDNLDYSNYPTIRNKYLTTIDLFLITHFFNYSIKIFRYSIISRCVSLNYLKNRSSCLNNRRMKENRKNERERRRRNENKYAKKYFEEGNQHPEAGRSRQQEASAEFHWETGWRNSPVVIP